MPKRQWQQPVLPEIYRSYATGWSFGKKSEFTSFYACIAYMHLEYSSESQVKCCHSQLYQMNLLRFAYCNFPYVP